MSTAEAGPRSRWAGSDVTVERVLDQLCAQRRLPDGGAPLVLSAVLNLVAYAADEDEERGMAEVIERLADHQPSRAILMRLSAEGTGIDAAVATSTRISDGRTAVALETVRLTLRGDVREGAASALRPLLRSDLPTVLWWPRAAGAGADPALPTIAGIADRVVTEIARSPDPCVAVRGLAEWVPGASQAVTDLSWAAVTSWRQLLAQMLDGEGLQELRAGGCRAILQHAPGPPDAEAVLLAGWLRDLVGPGLAITTAPQDDGDGPGVIAVELRGATGRCLRVRRAPGREAATVTVRGPDGSEQGRTLPLPRPDRARLLAGELELQRRDRAFERALLGACLAGVA